MNCERQRFFLRFIFLSIATWNVLFYNIFYLFKTSRNNWHIKAQSTQFLIQIWDSTNSSSIIMNDSVYPRYITVYLVYPRYITVYPVYPRYITVYPRY